MSCLGQQDCTQFQPHPNVYAQKKQLRGLRVSKKIQLRAGTVVPGAGYA